MRPKPNALFAFLVLALCFGTLYWPVLRKLVADWWADENYSHGFFIIPVAAFFVWERRRKLQALPVRPSLVGLVVILGSIGVLLAGMLGAELFLTRISMLGVVGGSVLFILGWRHLQALLFPLAFTLLMIPIPAIVFNQIAFPLQLLASQVGELALRVFSIPVLREGNVMILANTSLEVAEACSGIRSLISLITLGIVYGYFIDQRLWVRTALVAAAIPIAVFTNGLRVSGTGIAAHFYGSAAAEGFSHTFSGYLVFLAAFGLMMGTAKLIQRLSPPPGERSSINEASVVAA